MATVDRHNASQLPYFLFLSLTKSMRCLITLILQMREIWLRKGKRLAEGHTASKSSDPNLADFKVSIPSETEGRARSLGSDPPSRSSVTLGFTYSTFLSPQFHLLSNGNNNRKL